MSAIKHKVNALFFHPLFSRLRQAQFIVALAIFCYMALKPLGPVPAPWPPELLHFIGNILLIASAWTALFPRLRLPTIFVLSLIISVSAELAQSFTSTRITDPLDFLANLLGLGLGSILCVLGEKFLLGPFYTKKTASQ